MIHKTVFQNDILKMTHFTFDNKLIEENVKR